MVSGAPTKHAPNALDSHSGLPLHKFLSTLDWVRDSHQVSDSSENSKEHACPTCSLTKPDSASDDVAISTDHLTGFASFRIGLRDVIAFAPPQSGQDALSSIPATISADDGKLRIALRASEHGPVHCFTANPRKIIDEPSLHNTGRRLRLDIAFPFVSLVFHRSRHAEQRQDASGSGDARFTAMRDAISELRELPSSIDQMAEADTGENKELEFVSLYDKELDRFRSGEGYQDRDMCDIVSGFSWKAALMTVPQAFPYTFQTGTLQTEQEEQCHVAFADAFLQLEVVRINLVQKAEACVQAAVGPKAKVEDRMMMPAEIENRRKKMKIG